MTRRGGPNNANKIRVLFFTSALGGGGAERHLVRVANHLDPDVFDVAVAVTRLGGAYESTLAPHVTLHGLDTGRVESSMVRMVRAVKPLRALVAAERIDVVCSALDHANLAAERAVSGLARPPRLVLCVQNSIEASYRSRWNPRHRAMRRGMRRRYPRADRVVALSHGVAGELRRLIPTIGERLSVIYNAGLDDEVRTRCVPTQERPAAPLVVACGRLTEQKGYPYLIDAMKDVHARTGAHLWICGDGPLRDAVERRVRDAGLAHAVRLLGFQDNPFQYVAAGDVFALSSLWEGFGNVVVEAMACGTAVVVTDCPHGPGEIVTDGVDGRLVPPADAVRLADVLVETIRDDEARARMAEAGRRRAEDFSAERIARQYGRLFETLARPSERSRTGPADAETPPADAPR